MEMEMRQHAAGRPRPGRVGRWRLAAALVAAAGLVVGARPAPANITIKGPTNHTASANITGVPKGLKATVTLNPDPVTYLAAAAAKGLLDTTFQADIKQYPGWTLNFAGAGLNGTLQINDYLARDLGGGEGGARMDATYTPGKGDPGTLTFVQVFVENAAAGGGTHVDPFPRNYKTPFYYTDAEQKKHGLNFIDNPSDTVTAAGVNPAVTFDTYLVSFDSKKKTVTAYDGWQWGYQFNVVKAGGGGGAPSPEPGTMTLMAVGGGCLAWARRRSRTKAEGAPC
jgi:hypothetical protein